jgi:uncharacterized membrane protein YccC
MMFAGALCFLIYLQLPWPNGYWAVVTVGAVVRPGITNTAATLLTRFAGTLIGSTLAYTTLVVTGGNSVATIVIFFAVIFLSSFIALQRTIYNYGGIVIGLTLTIVIAAGLMLGDPLQGMVLRVLDVLIGVCCVALIDLILSPFFPHEKRVAQQLRRQFREGWRLLWAEERNKAFVRNACAIALAASATFFPWLYWRYAGGFWATISCLFVMEESFVGVKKRSLFRLLTHIIAAIFGGVAALIIGDHELLLIIPLLIGFFLCGLSMGLHPVLRTAGNTLAIALAIMLLADPGSALDVIAARFLNVIGGIVVGVVVSYFVQNER